MERRGFLKLLSAGIVGYTLDADELLWKPGTKKIFDMGRVLPVSLYGVPYHQSNAFIGTWLGFDRTITPEFLGKITNVEASKPFTIPLHYINKINS